MDDRIARTHKDLDVWKRALTLAEQTYLATRELPVEERYGLSAQMRRAAVSILSNISEGAARCSRRDYLRFLYMARGSLSELAAQHALVARLAFGCERCGRLGPEIERVGQLLTAQIASLSRDRVDPWPG